MPKRILVVLPGYVGDMIMAQSLLKLLKKRHANVEIDVFAESFFCPLLKRIPEIRKVITVSDSSWLKRLVNMPKRLKLKVLFSKLYLTVKLARLGLSLAGYYDQAIVLGIDAGKPMLFMLKIAQIPVRVGYSKKIGYGFRVEHFLTDPRKPVGTALPRTVDQFMQLGLPLKTPFVKCDSYLAPKLMVDSENAGACIKRFGLKTVGHGRLLRRMPVLALAPGSRYGHCLSRIWPPRHFSRVADYYSARGWQIWIFGSMEERWVGEQIIRTTKAPAHNLCGKTKLVDAIDLLSRAHLVISNDTGLAHIAAAVDCSVVTIYGSSSPNTSPPLSEKAKVLWYELPCSRCGKFSCPYGHYRCLTEITPQAVIEAADDLINEHGLADVPASGSLVQG